MANNEEIKTNETKKGSHRIANIIVITVVSLAVLVLVAIAVLSSVHVDPLSGLAQPETYYFYDLGADSPAVAGDSASQSKIRAATGDMEFSIMSAILQGNWDYSYNFKRNADGDKIEISAVDLAAVKGDSAQYMLELVYPQVPVVNGALDYSKAQSLEVDGETVYFDRVKVLIGNTNGLVGIIELYPYLYARLSNQSDIDGLASDRYKVTGINVRANTGAAYVALGDLAKEL